MFCKKCQSILVPKKKGKKTVMWCSECKKSQKDVKTVMSEKVKSDDVGMEVVKDDVETKSITNATCPECGHDKAYYWFVQTRASDESATQFLKCVKCKHQWRDYD
ncbi:MAG: Transcription factor S [Candidatus Woesearchaeota archaeon]|nr:Transcription factor S [Candidatus Woesearchaeota archaeon]